MSTEITTPPAEAASRATPRTACAAVAALRPRQWTKNLLLFGGILFGAQFGDGTRWLQALVAFAAYCLASSAAYLVNDIRDAAADRLHPRKRRRPVARGDLAPRTAVALAAAAAVAALALAAVIGRESLGLLIAFLALQGAYTLALKAIVLLDILAIAGLFVLRAAAGAVAVDVPSSSWLLICTAFLALFLVLAKRRAELRLVATAETPGRAVLADYPVALVDQLVSVAAASAVISYSLYTFTAHDSDAMMLTIPFVLYGVFRYLLLVEGSRGEEPEDVLLNDPPLLLAIALWAAVAAAILVAE